MSNIKVRLLIFENVLAIAGTTIYIKLQGYLHVWLWDMVNLISYWSNWAETHRMYLVGYEEHSYQIWS